MGHFFGVGSLGEPNPSVPLDYVKKLKLPYAYSIPARQEEDMIRQFAVLVEDFEHFGTFILDVDIHSYREMTGSDEPLMIDRTHGQSSYLMIDGFTYSFFKTQQTAPATMCYSIRDTSGKQHVTRNMFHFFQKLMRRIAKGQVEHFGRSCENLILCQDDPGLGHVFEAIKKEKVLGLTLDDIVQKTDDVYPDSVIPAYHYCDDWRQLVLDGWYPLWDSKPKLAHIDVIRYLPEVDEEQAERMNLFMKRGGGLALGALPNTDDSFSMPILETLQFNLAQSFRCLNDSGVDLELLKRNAMVSTQCGLSGASSELSKKIHEESSKFREIFLQTIESSS